MKFREINIGNARICIGPAHHCRKDCSLALFWGRREEASGLAWFENSIALLWDWPRVEFCRAVEREATGVCVPATRWTGRKRAIKRLTFPVSFHRDLAA